MRIGSIIFSDFRLVERFTTACHDDISKFNCGRLDSDEEVFTNFPKMSYYLADIFGYHNYTSFNFQKDHKQGSTIECLSEHVKDLTKECHLQTLRVAELQVSFTRMC